ncbi:hypothetical protein DFH28DRAFT_1131450 [Melampsora americana]|nr:hypothetical protein DFH28DRAFT_1131450 [Melampsora americana]
MSSHLYPPSVPFRRPLAPRHGRNERNVAHPVLEGRADVYDDSQHPLRCYIERLHKERKERDSHLNRSLDTLHADIIRMSEKIENVVTEQEHMAKRNRKTQDLLTRVKKNCAELNDNVDQNFRDLWEERTSLDKKIASAQGQDAPVGNECALLIFRGVKKAWKRGARSSSKAVLVCGRGAEETFSGNQRWEMALASLSHATEACTNTTTP